MIKTSKYPEGIRTMDPEQIDKIMEGFVEINLPDGVEFYDAVNAIKSFGMMNESQSKLCQTCHVFKKRGKIFIVHFKQLLALDGRQVQMDEGDFKRLQYIAQQMQRFGFAKLVNDVEVEHPHDLGIKVLMIADPSSDEIKLMTPGYDNIQLEKKYTFD